MSFFFDFFPSTVMATVVNCTPHPVRIALGPERLIELTPAEEPARLLKATPRREALCCEGEAVPVLVAPPPQRVEHLPPPRPSTYYLVSTVVATALAGRPDLLAPATGPGEGALRDDEGRITGVTQLRRFSGALRYAACSPDSA